MFHYLLEELLLGGLDDAKKDVDERPISDEWRGANYANFGLLPDLTLPLYCVADRTIQRDRLLKELKGGVDPKSKEREAGRFYHEIFSYLYRESRDFVLGNSRAAILQNLEGHLESQEETAIKKIMGKRYDEWSDIAANLAKIWFYESQLLRSRVYFYCSRYPQYDPNNIAERVFRFRSKYKFDGTNMHLSENSEVDLFRRDGVNVVIDIKTGKPEPYHYLTVVGYALAVESSPEEVDRVDIGCILYVNFVASDPMPNISCKFYPLRNSYRLDFVDELTQKLNWYGEDKS